MIDVQGVVRKLTAWAGQHWLFAATLVGFTVESSWLAVTSRFPMAFDEAYHFGLIRFFGHRLNPIANHQAPSTYKYGAIVQNPSLLYHYLLSFPYRLIELFSKSPEVQVIGLRLTNVLFVILTLLVARKLLLRLRLPAAGVNLVLVVFALTPIMCVLAAQINYDNLLILLVSLAAYQTVAIVQAMPARGLEVQRGLMLLGLCLTASLVQFSFLPIFLAIAAIISWQLMRRSQAKQPLLARFHVMQHPFTLVLFLWCLVTGAWCGRIYVDNIVTYHNPVPQCNQVLSVAACRHYYAWDNNYLVRQHNVAEHARPQLTIVQYTAFWGMLTVMGLYGESMPLQGLDYISTPFAVIVGLIGLAAIVGVITSGRKLLRSSPSLGALALITVTYVFSLWARNYHDYVHLGGNFTAINSRYLTIILLYVYALLALGLWSIVQRFTQLQPTLRAGLIITVVVTFVFWGGFTQYLWHITPIYGHLSASNDFELRWDQ